MARAYERKLPTTGYWIFVSNTNTWAADRFLESGQTETLYTISNHHEFDVKPGQLGLLRINNDQRTRAQRHGRPKVEAGVYAIVEVLTVPHRTIASDPTFYIDPAAANEARFRVTLRIVSNHIHNPLLVPDLPSDREFQYLRRPLQTSSIAISKSAFERVLALLNVQQTVSNAGPTIAASSGIPPALEPGDVSVSSSSAIKDKYSQEKKSTSLGALGHEGADSERTIGPLERALLDMKRSIQQTVMQSRGQSELRVVKLKNLLMSEDELDKLLRELMDRQKARCELTGLPFQLPGPQADLNFLPSADRIDSNGHYERGNIQLVCRFINFWKQDTDNEEFKRLLQFIRGTAPSGPANLNK